MFNKNINLKKSIFVICLIFISPIIFCQEIDLGEDLKGDCIATLADQNRSELLDIKLNLEDLSEEDSSDTTQTKSK